MPGNFTYTPERLRVSRIYNAPAAVQEHRAKLAISLLSPYMRAAQLENSAYAPQHTIHYFDDKGDVETSGLKEAVTDLVRLGNSWREKKEISPTIVHCHYGVSRSPAANRRRLHKLGRHP